MHLFMGSPVGKTVAKQSLYADESCPMMWLVAAYGRKHFHRPYRIYMTLTELLFPHPIFLKLFQYRDVLSIYEIVTANIANYVLIINQQYSYLWL